MTSATAAGRELLNKFLNGPGGFGHAGITVSDLERAILAIEAEARGSAGAESTEGAAAPTSGSLREALEQIAGLYTDYRTRPASFAIQAGEIALAALAAIPEPEGLDVDVLARAKPVVDRIIGNSLAYGKPLTTEYPSRAQLRHDVKELAAILFGDSFHEDAEYARLMRERQERGGQR